MKKTTAGLTFAAVTGFGLLTAGPALAAEPAAPSVPRFANCTEAREAGRTNIPSTDPEFTPQLDRNRNGIGCEADTPEVEPSSPPPTTPGNGENGGNGGMPGGGQVDRMPAGGANTGITQEPEESNAGILALGGGLVLAAAAGGTYVVRRRRAAG